MAWAQRRPELFGTGMVGNGRFDKILPSSHEVWSESDARND